MESKTICTKFESQLWRPQFCKECFRKKEDHDKMESNSSKLVPRPNISSNRQPLPNLPQKSSISTTQSTFQKSKAATFSKPITPSFYPNISRTNPSTQGMLILNKKKKGKKIWKRQNLEMNRVDAERSFERLNDFQLKTFELTKLIFFFGF